MTPPARRIPSPAPCPFCQTPGLLQRAHQMTESGRTDGEIAQQCAVSVQQLAHHRSVCGPRLAAKEAEVAAQDAQERLARESAQLARMTLEPLPDGPLEGDAIIARLNSYLAKVEAVIEASPVGDLRGTLMALDQARKTCETMAKLYLDIMKAQLDASVQSEFRRIVMEAINATDPDTRQRIIAAIQSRTAIFGVLGGAGM